MGHRCARRMERGRSPRRRGRAHHRPSRDDVRRAGVRDRASRRRAGGPCGAARFDVPRAGPFGRAGRRRHRRPHHPVVRCGARRTARESARRGQRGGSVASVGGATVHRWAAGVPPEVLSAGTDDPRDAGPPRTDDTRGRSRCAARCDSRRLHLARGRAPAEAGGSGRRDPLDHRPGGRSRHRQDLHGRTHSRGTGRPAGTRPPDRTVRADGPGGGSAAGLGGSGVDGSRHGARRHAPLVARLAPGCQPEVRPRADTAARRHRRRRDLDAVDDRDEPSARRSPSGCTGDLRR